jgi:hypothetical protein
MWNFDVVRVRLSTSVWIFESRLQLCFLELSSKSASTSISEIVECWNTSRKEFAFWLFCSMREGSYIFSYSGSRTHPSMINLPSSSNSQYFGTKLRDPHSQYQASYPIQHSRTDPPVVEDFGVPRAFLETQVWSNNRYSEAFSFKPNISSPLMRFFANIW